MAQGTALGLLQLQNGLSGLGQPEERCEHLTGSKQHLAVTFGEHIALALAHLKLRESLRDQAIRDPLTSLFNRRYMEESLEGELRRAIRKQRPLGVIMLDLDHFKRFNDTFGHEAGDTLLREFANFLKTHVRREDIICRYGGEEFTLILPEASLENTCKRAEQIREAVQFLRVEYRRRSLGAVTISLGVAAFPEHGSSPDALLRAADAALYRAKAEGRDQVVRQMADGRDVKGDA
jgi:diguanylate cyclase (GGDEF)-like protein